MQEQIHGYSFISCRNPMIKIRETIKYSNLNRNELGDKVDPNILITLINSMLWKFLFNVVVFVLIWKLTRNICWQCYQVLMTMVNNIFWAVSIQCNFIIYFYFLAFNFLSVLRSHSFLSSPPQRPLTSYVEGFSIPDSIHYIHFPFLILEKEPVFPFWMFSAKQGNYWYLFYNVFGMTRSLTGDWTQGLPHSKPALYH